MEEIDNYFYFLDKYTLGASKYDIKWFLANFDLLTTYSKVFFIRPGRSRLLEFGKKDSTGPLIETFSKYPDQVLK